MSKRTAKESIAGKRAQEGDHGVKGLAVENIDAEALNAIAAEIGLQYETAKNLYGGDDEMMIVIARRGETVQKLESIVGRNQPGLKFCTYHGAKGAQAEVAFMVEDCAYDQLHIVRNRVYEASGLFEPNYDYDRAMREEALRFAYVGATRGCRKVFWHYKNQKGAAQLLFPMNE